MNAGEQPVIGLTDTYTSPGVYMLEIPCPRTRSTATIHIELTDEVRRPPLFHNASSIWVASCMWPSPEATGIEHLRSKACS